MQTRVVTPCGGAVHGCPVGLCGRSPLLQARGSPVGCVRLLAPRARAMLPIGRVWTMLPSGTCGRISSNVARVGSNKR
eukprot:5727607-Prymnesium_polylepis.1